MNILIIEDDELLAEKIKNIFQSKIITNRVCVSPSLIEFYHHIPILSSYDIILTDIKLSHDFHNTDGFEIIKIIRKKDIKIPIVVISGNSNIENLLSEPFLIEKIWGDIYFIVNRNLRINILRLKKWLSPFWIDSRIQNIHWEWYIFCAQ